jgi:lysophospholipase L1-like esterase
MTNKMIEDYSRSQERVQFIDVSTAMLDAQGKPRHELFRWDGLHMNAQGYSVSLLIPRIRRRTPGAAAPWHP